MSDGRYPLLVRTCTKLLANRVLGKLVAHLVLNGDDRWWTGGERLLARCFASKGADETAFDRAIEGYVYFCYDMLKEQSAFTARGKYSHDDWDRVNELIYAREDVMEGYYLDGILFSTVLWPNHYRIYRDLFCGDFIGGLGKAREVLEVGTGPGHLFSEILARFPEARMTGVDISEYSRRYTSRIASVVDGSRSRFRLVDHNVNEGLPPDLAHEFDGVILGEVVEHLSNPFPLMHDCHRRLRNDGLLYFTTAINAASVDHIFLLRTVREVHEMLRACSFEVMAELPLRAEGAPIVRDEKGREFVPINYAAVARKIGPE